MRAAAVVLVLLVGAAHADPAPKARADALFDKGQAHYQAGEYQAAIESFLSAYELVHDPVYLFNIAQSYRKIANCVGAYDYYARYLAEAKDAPNRDKVSGWLRELEPCADKTRAEHDAAVKAAEEDRQHARRPRTRSSTRGWCRRRRRRCRWPPAIAGGRTGSPGSRPRARA